MKHHHAIAYTTTAFDNLSSYSRRAITALAFYKSNCTVNEYKMQMAEYRLQQWVRKVGGRIGTLQVFSYLYPCKAWDGIHMDDRWAERNNENSNLRLNSKEWVEQSTKTAPAPVYRCIRLCAPKIWGKAPKALHRFPISGEKKIWI